MGGGTSREAESAIAKLLQDGGFVNQAQVNLIVTQFHSQQISVLGQVNRPGKYAVESASTVLDLLARNIKASYQSTDESAADTIAWMLKAMARAGNKKYLPLMEEVSNSSIDYNISRHAESAVRAWR